MSNQFLNMVYSVTCHTTLIWFSWSMLIPSTYIQMTQNSVNLKHSLVLNGIFRFRPVSQFVERYHSIVSCALNVEDLISNNFCKFSNK
jgi:hypothetical protein